MKLRPILILIIALFCFAKEAVNFKDHNLFTTILQSHFTPLPYQDGTRIAFSNGISFDTRNLGKSGEPDLPAGLKTQYGDDESGYYIVQFSGPIYEPDKDWLESFGAIIHFYIPNYGFVITARNRAVVEAIRANSRVNWLGIYQPAYKISGLFNSKKD